MSKNATEEGEATRLPPVSTQDIQEITIGKYVFAIKQDCQTVSDPVSIAKDFASIIDMERTIELQKKQDPEKTTTKRKNGRIIEDKKPIATVGNIAIYKDRVIDIWNLFGQQEFTPIMVTTYLMEYYGDDISPGTAYNKQRAYIEYMRSPEQGFIKVNKRFGNTKLYRFVKPPYT